MFARAASAATAARKKQEEAAAVRGLSSQELLQLQRSQMRKQDDAMEEMKMNLPSHQRELAQQKQRSGGASAS